MSCPRDLCKQAEEIVTKLEQLGRKRSELGSQLKPENDGKGQGAIIEKLVTLIAGKTPVIGMQHHSASLR